MDKMEIISLPKRCNKKARNVSWPKKSSGSPKSDQPEKASESPKSNEPKKAGLLMIQAGKDRSLKKHQAMEERLLQRQEKKLKRPHSLKNHQIHLNLLIQARKKKKGHPRTIKGKKCLLCLE